MGKKDMFLGTLGTSVQQQPFPSPTKVSGVTATLAWIEPHRDRLTHHEGEMWFKNQEVVLTGSAGFKYVNVLFYYFDFWYAWANSAELSITSSHRVHTLGLWTPCHGVSLDHLPPPQRSWRSMEATAFFEVTLSFNTTHLSCGQRMLSIPMMAFSVFI